MYSKVATGIISHFIKSTSHLKAWPKYLGKCLLFERVTLFSILQSHAFDEFSKYHHAWNKEKCAVLCKCFDLVDSLHRRHKLFTVFFPFAKQIANTVCSQAMWMKRNFESENKHLKRTKTNKMIFLNIQIKCVFFCFSEFMSTLFKWQRSFQKSKAIERGAVDLSCGHFAWKHMLSFKMEIRRC